MTTSKKSKAYNVGERITATALVEKLADALGDGLVWRKRQGGQ